MEVAMTPIDKKKAVEFFFIKIRKYLFFFKMRVGKSFVFKFSSMKVPTSFFPKSKGGHKTSWRGNRRVPFPN